MSNVKVAVRTRPLNKKEVDQGAKFIVDVNGDTLSITNTKVESLSEYGDSRERVKHFTFDYCYNSYDQPQSPIYASQELLFQDLGTEVLEAAFEGYNACVVAYGQTSTGKTYTMMGHHGEVGLIPRICEGLFARVDDYEADEITFRVDISYLEIYNERVRDMLNCKDNERYTLKVREHPKEGPYVQDLSRHLVKDNAEIQTLLEKGNDLRVTAATHMHDHSSRSHAIITITFTQASLVDDLPSEIISKINLVDLAGSERADTTVKTGYKGRLKEGANINKSLVTLGNVIKSLAEKSLLSWSTESMSSLHNSSASETMTSPHSSPRKQRSFYIPYRDSVLTWLLKDSLGGNSKTIMIATITPASSYYSESLSTLRYAQRAKSIINKPKINEDPNVTIIREMKREIERLRQMLATAQMTSSQQNEIVFIVPIKRKKHESESDKQAGPLMSLQESGTNTFLFERIQENEDKANQLTKTWLDKWQETQDILDESDLSIRRPLGRRASSQGVIVDSQLPHLIGMDDDILSTGVIIYHLKEGKTRIGKEDANQEQDIGLCGPCIQREHCIIKNVLGTVTLYPNRGALCAVNGIDLREPQRLTQGDVILLGKTHMFRFNHPEEAAKLREHRRTQSLVDASDMCDTGMDGASSPNLTLPTEVASPVAASRPQMRMFTARRELEEVREAQRQTEATYHEKEDTVFRVHEEHRAEIEQQKARLALLIEEAQADRARAEEEMIVARQRLEDEREEHATMLAIELTKLAEIREKQKLQRGVGNQSESYLEGDNDDTETDVPGDLVSPTVCPEGKALRVRKTSIEGKIKDLAQVEMMQKWSERETEVGLARQEEELEDQFEHTQEQILLHQQKIQEIEDRYKATDASHYEEIAAQVKELNALQRKEEQLEMYLEEKQDLLKVEEFKPQPLRGACSAELLTEVETAEIFAQKFSGRRGSDGDLPARGYMFAADSSCSLNTTSKESSDGSHSLHSAQSASNMSLDSLSETQLADKSKDIGSKKISHRAQCVTDRLYKAPPNKPRKQATKESQLANSTDRGTKSSNSGSRDLKTKKPPVEKYSHSRHKLGLKGHHIQQKTNQRKKGTNTQSSEKSTQPKSSISPKKAALPGVTKKGIPVKAFEAFNPSQGSDQSHSITDSGQLYRAPFRPGFCLRQVSSASSLASVPEDEREETELDDTVTQSETDITSGVVLRKRSRRLGRDEEYKRHSAPVGDKLASYSNIMTPGLPLQQSKMSLAGDNHAKQFVAKKGPSDLVWKSHVRRRSPQNVSDPDLNKYTSSSASRSESEEEFFSAGGSSSSIPVIVITDNSDNEMRLSTSPECTFQDSAQMEGILDNTDVSMNSSTVTIASTVIENPDYFSSSDDSISACGQDTPALDPVEGESPVRAGSKRENVHIPDNQQLIEVKRQKQSSACENVSTTVHLSAFPEDSNVTDPKLNHSSPAVEDLSFSGDSLEGQESDQQPSQYLDLEEANFEDSLELLRQPASGVEMMETSNNVALPSEASLQPVQCHLSSSENNLEHADPSTDQTVCTETMKPEQEDNSNSDFSMDSIQDAKEKLETLQEVLQQLKPKSSSKSSSGSSGRRTRQRAHFRHHTSLESDCSEHFSDDSLGSEPCSKPSSRPGSASKRRRRPQTKAQDTPVKKSKAMSSEEYVTSDSDGVYSDDSLTYSDNRILSNPDMSTVVTSESAVQEIATIANSIQHLTHALNSRRSSMDRSGDRADSVPKNNISSQEKVLPPMTSWSSSPEIHKPSFRDSASVRGKSEPPDGQSSLLKSKLSRLSRSVTNVMTFDGHTDDNDGGSRAAEDKKYNFVIHRDELNVVYNVQRTEYNTAGLRPVEYTVPKKAVVYTVDNSLHDFPESIDITLTETSRTHREDKIHTTHTEQVLFKMPDNHTSGDAHVTEHGYLSSYNSHYSQVSDGGNVSRESSVEKTFKDENTNSYIKCDKSSGEGDITKNTESEPLPASLAESVKHTMETLSRDKRTSNKEQDSGLSIQSAEVSGTSTPDIIQGHPSVHGLDPECSEEGDMNVSVIPKGGEAELSGMTMPMLLGESDPEGSAHIKGLVEFVNALPEPDVIVNQVEDSHSSENHTKSCNSQLYLPVLMADEPSENSYSGTTDRSKARPVIYVGGVDPSKTSSSSLSLDQLVQSGKQILIPVSSNLLQTSLSTDSVSPVLHSLCHAAIGTTSSPAAGKNSLQSTPSMKPLGLTVNENITRQLQWTDSKPESAEEASGYSCDTSVDSLTKHETSDVPSINYMKEDEAVSSELCVNTDLTDSKDMKNVSPSIVVVNGQSYLNFRPIDSSHVKHSDNTGAVLQIASTELHQTLENMVKALKAAENLAFPLPEKSSRYSKTSFNSDHTEPISLSQQADTKDHVNLVCKADVSGDVIDSSAHRSSKRSPDGTTAFEHQMENIFGSQLVYIDGLPYIQIERVEHVPERACFQPKAQVQITKVQISERQSIPMHTTLACGSFPESQAENGVKMWTETCNQTETSITEVLQDEDINKPSSQSHGKAEELCADTEFRASKTDSTQDTIGNEAKQSEDTDNTNESQMYKETCPQPKNESKPIEIIVKNKEDSPSSIGPVISERKKDVVLKVKGNDDIVLTTEVPIAASVDHQMVRRELEKRIAKLEKHVGRVSDSAISSDYTDGETTVLSPKSSRTFDTERNVASLKKVLFPHDLAQLSVPDTYTVQVGLERTEGQSVKNLSSRPEPDSSKSRSDTALGMVGETKSLYPLKTDLNSEEIDADADYLVSFKERSRGPLSPTTPDSALGSSVFQSEESGNSNLGSTFSGCGRLFDSLPIPLDESLPLNKSDESRRSNPQQKGVELQSNPPVQKVGLQPMFKAMFHPCRSDQNLTPATETSCRVVKGAGDQQESSHGASFERSKNNQSVQNNFIPNGDSCRKKERSSGLKKEGHVKQRFTGPHRQKHPYTKSMRDTPTSDDKVENRRSRHKSYLGVEIDSICNLPKDEDAMKSGQMDGDCGELSISGVNSCSTFIPDTNSHSNGQLTMNRLFTVFSSAEEASSQSSESDDDRDVESSGTYQALPKPRIQCLSSDELTNTALNPSTEELVSDGNYIVKKHLRQENKGNKPNLVLSTKSEESKHSGTTGQTVYIIPEDGSVLRSLQLFMEQGDQALSSSVGTAQRTESFPQSSLLTTSAPVNMFQESSSSNVRSHGTENVALNNSDLTRQQRNKDRSTPGFSNTDIQGINYEEGSVLQSLRDFMDSGCEGQLHDGLCESPFKRKGIIRGQVEAENTQSGVGLEQPANDLRTSYQIHGLGTSVGLPQYMPQYHKDIVDASEVPDKTDSVASGSFSAEKQDLITCGIVFPRDSMQLVRQNSLGAVGYTPQISSRASDVNIGSRALTEQDHVTHGLGLPQSFSPYVPQSSPSITGYASAIPYRTDVTSGSLATPKQDNLTSGLNLQRDSTQYLPQSSPDFIGYTWPIPYRTDVIGGSLATPKEDNLTSGFNLQRDSTQYLPQSSPDFIGYTWPIPYRTDVIGGSLEDGITHGLRSTTGRTPVPQNSLGVVGHTSQMSYGTDHVRSSSRVSPEEQDRFTQHAQERSYGIIDNTPSLPFTTVDVARSQWVSTEQQNESGGSFRHVPEVTSGSVQNTHESPNKTVNAGRSPWYLTEQHDYQSSQGITQNPQTYNNFPQVKDNYTELKPITLTQSDLNETTGVDSKPVPAKHNTASARPLSKSPSRRPGKTSYRKASNYDSSSSDSELENIRFQLPHHNFSYHDSDSDPDLDRVDQAIKVAMILAGNEYAGRQSSSLIRMTSPRLLRSPPTGLLQLVPLFDVRYQQNHSPPLPQSTYLSEDENTIKVVPTSQVPNDQNLDQDWILRHRSQGDMEPWQTFSGQVVSQKVNGKVSVNSALSHSAGKNVDGRFHQPAVTNKTTASGVKKDALPTPDNMYDGQAHDADWINRNRSQADTLDSWNTVSSQSFSPTVSGRTGVSSNATGHLPNERKINEGHLHNSSTHPDGASLMNPQGISGDVPGYGIQPGTTKLSAANEIQADKDFDARYHQPIVQNKETVGGQKEYPLSRPDTRYKDQREDAAWINQNRSQVEIHDSWNTLSSMPISQSVSGRTGISVGSVGHFPGEQNIQEERNAPSRSTDYSQGHPFKQDGYIDQSEDSDWINRNRPQAPIPDSWNTKSSQPISHILLGGTTVDSTRMGPQGNSIQIPGYSSLDESHRMGVNSSSVNPCDESKTVPDIEQHDKKDYYPNGDSRHLQGPCNDQVEDADWINRNRPEREIPGSWVTHSSQPISQTIVGRTGVGQSSNDPYVSSKPIPQGGDKRLKSFKANQNNYVHGGSNHSQLPCARGVEYDTPGKDHAQIAEFRPRDMAVADWYTPRSMTLSESEAKAVRFSNADKGDSSADNESGDYVLDSLPHSRHIHPIKDNGLQDGSTGFGSSRQDPDKDEYHMGSFSNQDSDREWVSRHRAPRDLPEDWTTSSSQLLSQEVLGRTGVVADSSGIGGDLEGIPVTISTVPEVSNVSKGGPSIFNSFDGHVLDNLPGTSQMCPLKDQELQDEHAQFDQSQQGPDKDQQGPDKDEYQTDSSNHQDSDREWVSMHRAPRDLPENWTTSSSQLLSQKVLGRTGVVAESSDIDSDLEGLPVTDSANYLNGGHDDGRTSGHKRSSLASEDELTDSDAQGKDKDWIARNRVSRDSAEPWITNSSHLIGQNVTGRSGVVPEYNDDTMQEEKHHQLNTENTGVETPASTSSDEGIGKSCQLLDHNWILNNRHPGEFSPAWRADSSLMSSCVNNVITHPSVVDTDNMVKPESVTELDLSPRGTKADSLTESSSTLDLDGQLSDQDWVNRNRKVTEFPDDWATHSSQLLDQTVIGRTGVTVEPESDSSGAEDLGYRVRGRSLSVATSDTDRHQVNLPERSQSVDDGDYIKDSDGRALSNDSITWVFIGPAEQHNRSVQTEGSYHDDSEMASADDESESGDPPLRHKYGIDDSMLPLSERTVSDDNLPKYSREDVRRPHSSCGILRNTMKSPSPEIENIFPSKPPEEDYSPTIEEQLCYSTAVDDHDEVRVVTRGVSPSKLSKSGRRHSAFLMEDIPAVSEPVESKEHITPSHHQNQNISSSLEFHATLPKMDRSTSTHRKKRSKLVSRGIQSESFEEDTKESSPVKEYTISDTQTEESDWRGLSDLMLETNSLLRNLSERIPDHESPITPKDAAQVESLSKTVKIKDTSIQTSDTEDHSDKVDSMVSSVDSTTQTVLNESTQTDTVASVLSGTQTVGTEIANTAVQTQAEAAREPEQSKLDFTIDMSVQTDEGVDLFSPNSSFNLTGSLLSSEFIVDDIPDLDISTDIQSLRDEHDRMMSLLRRARSAREARQEALRKRPARTPLPLLEEEQLTPRPSPSPPSSMDTPMQLPAIPTFSPSSQVSQTRASQLQGDTPKPRHITVINSVDRDREVKLVLNMGCGEPGAPIAEIVLKDNSNEAPSFVGDSSQGLVATRVCRDKTSSTTTSVTTDGESIDGMPEINVVSRQVDHRPAVNERAISTDRMPEINVVSGQVDHRPAVNERAIPIKIQHLETTFPSGGGSSQAQNLSFSESHKDNVDTIKKAEECRSVNGRHGYEDRGHSLPKKESDQNRPEVRQQSSEVHVLHPSEPAVKVNTYSEQRKNNRNKSSAQGQDFITSPQRNLVNDSNQAQLKNYSEDRSISTDKSVRHILNSSDEFTQTDFDIVNGHKDTKPLSGSLHSKCVEGSDTDPISMQDELERLQQERVEILELLSLNYLPSSLTIELLEAKLNYCIGQTDLILASIEETWDADGGDGAAVAESENHQQDVITEDYILRYKEDLAKSKKTIASCMDRMERIQGRGRGRTRTRNSDITQMRRKAEIEAFKLERMREQNEFGRTRSLSPYKHSQVKCSPNTTYQSADLELAAASSETSLIMSPRDHKDYLVTLRKQLVRAVAEDEMERQERSFSSDTHWTPRSLNSSFRSFSSGLDYSSSREVSPEFRISDYLYNFDVPSVSNGVSFSARSNREMSATANAVMKQRAEGKMMDHQHQHLAHDSEKLLEEYQEMRLRASSEISQARETLKPRPRPLSPHNTRSSRQAASSHVTHHAETSGPLSISRNAVDEELKKMRQAYSQQSSPTLRYLDRRDTTSLTRRGSSLPGRPSRLSRRPLSADHSYSRRKQSLSSTGTLGQSSYHSYTDYAKSVLSHSERKLHHLSPSSTAIPKRSTFDTRQTSPIRRPCSAKATTSSSAAQFGVSKPSPRSHPDSVRLSYRSSSSVSEAERNRYARTRPISSADIKSKIQCKVKPSRH
ncbi:uncharacterized protein LOC135468784 [Liolophura sinensis]|uniref:uncharacterized protein LOC135468784 n=1 Tax=Liolophura sinensis TaxID=3198878 RepID=UPI003157FEF7